MDMVQKHNKIFSCIIGKHYSMKESYDGIVKCVSIKTVILRRNSGTSHKTKDILFSIFAKMLGSYLFLILGDAIRLFQSDLNGTLNYLCFRCFTRGMLYVSILFCLFFNCTNENNYSWVHGEGEPLAMSQNVMLLQKNCFLLR